MSAAPPVLAESVSARPSFSLWPSGDACAEMARAVPSGPRPAAKKTRVLRIIARMNIGGPAAHATLLADGLDTDRYETCLLTGVAEESEGDYLELTGQRPPNLIQIPSLGREIAPRHDVSAYRHIARIIRAFRPDIVHTHTAKAGLLGRLAARANGVGIIVHTFHGHVLRGYFSRPKEAVFVQAERALARATTRLIAVSEHVRGELLAMGVGRPDRFEVVRPGFDLSGFVRGRSAQR